MRPYQNGAPTATPTRVSTRKNKGKKRIENTWVKAKVTAVKSSRKVRTKKDAKEEIQDLLARAANDSSLNGSYIQTSEDKKRTPVSAKALARAGNRIRKIRSLEAMKEKKNKTETNGTNGTNGTSGTNGHVEQAQEAMEVDGPAAKGVIQRTMSKIWRLPGGITGQVPYEDMSNGDEAKEKKEKEDKNEDKRSSCVIS